MTSEVEPDEEALDPAQLVAEAADAVVVYNGDTFHYLNEALCELTGYDRSELLGMPASALLHPGDRERLREYQFYRYDSRDPAEPDRAWPPTRFEARLITRDDDIRTCEFRVRVVDLDDEQATLAVVRDITDRAANEHDLVRRRDELKSLAGLNDLLLSVTRALVRTPSRRAVERIVCERFAGSDRYRCAWVWDLDAETPRVTSGIDAETVLALRDPEGPGARAARDGEVRTERDTPAPVGEGSEGTLGAVPLGGGDVIHGVLVAYADRLDAFGVDERSALAVFGETVGFVLTAIENRDLLVAEVATELVFHLDGGRSLFERLAARLDCRLRLQGYVAVDSDTQLWYLRLDDAADAIENLVGIDAIEAVRAVSDEGEGPLVELAVTGESFTRTAIDCGARVISARTVADGVRFTVEVAQNTPARSVVRRLTEAYPTVTVVAKRNQDRQIRSEEELLGSLRARLTEHQWIALRTAYLAGYYEWPRDSNGEVVAEALGVSSPTLHHHLRNGQRRILDVVFDDATTTTPDER